MIDSAKIIVPVDYDLPAIISAAGGDVAAARYEDGVLYVSDVDQAALNKALKGYDPNRVSVSPQVQIFTYKVDLFRRASEEEAEKIDAAIQGLSARMRRLFDGATRLDHDAEEFLVLQAAAIDLFGPGRADELLAPSV